MGISQKLLLATKYQLHLSLSPPPVRHHSQIICNCIRSWQQSLKVKGMSSLAVIAYTSSLRLRPPILSGRAAAERPLHHHSAIANLRHWQLSSIAAARAFPPPHFFRLLSFRLGCYQQGDAEDFSSASSGDLIQQPDRFSDLVFDAQGQKSTGKRGSFLAKLAIVVGIAVTITVVSVNIKRPDLGSTLGIQCVADVSSSSVVTSSSPGFTVKAFGYKFILPEYPPGWVYFWLLMAAGCGLFISEEALNIWVGITLSRMLTLDGTWQSLAQSFSRNAPYIISTVLWVYWGVCISDMLPFYLGKLFRQTGASDDVCARLGIGKDRAMSISQAVQKYGNLSGFVERFSLGVRNPTAFLAGAMGVSPECFFAGVCCGGLITLPAQLAIGFLLRERPIFALATVATVVGIWTLFPYAVAASTALFLYLQGRHSS